MTDKVLIFRADASASIGSGHVMRCLALAQAWRNSARREGGDCIFAMVQPMPSLQERLRAEGCEIAALNASPGSTEDAAQLSELARNRNAAWTVVDGYQFAAEYHRIVKLAGLRLLLIDDHGHTGTYFADLVLDQNFGTSERFYSRRELHTKLLLGPRYAMLRREFKPWQEWKREIAPVGRKILITMGGSDPEGLTHRAIQALEFLHFEEWEAIVVVGASNPHLPKLREQAERFQGRIRFEVDPGNMAELMAGADLAVSSAGSTCWEMCMVGLPAIVIDAAENQWPIASELARVQIALHIPLAQATPDRVAASLNSLVESAGLRRRMSERGRQLLDGHGADRVAATMIARSMIMRPVERGTPLAWDLVEK